MAGSTAGLGVLANIALNMNTASLTCGNETYDSKTTNLKSCSKPGKKFCSGCSLIAYCTVECLKKHWPTHKLICEAPYGRDDWAPGMTGLDSIDNVDVPLRKFLWGNIPAFDILNLKSNEGESYNKSLNLLFAASGDLRNVISTLNTLPIFYNRLCEVTINDGDTDIVIRNAIILLIMYTFPNRAEAVAAALHVWYSIAIPAHLWDQITTQLRPLVNEFYQSIELNSLFTQASKRWNFASGNIFLTLRRSGWKRLVEILAHDAASLDYTSVMTCRKTNLNGDKAKYSHKARMLKLPTSLRRPETRFRETGILLPFGEPVLTYRTINPTFLDEDGNYKMLSDESPLNGWTLTLLLESCRKFGLPENDVYGSLYHHVSSILLALSYRISALRFNFHLYNKYEDQIERVLAESVQSHANGPRFDRIETTVVDDEAFRFEAAISRFGRLLKPNFRNKHATVVVLYQRTLIANSGPEETEEEEAKTMRITKDMVKTIDILRKRKEVLPFYLRTMYPYFVEHDVLWKRFEEKARLAYWLSLYSLEIKPVNTIIEAWPFRLTAENDLESKKEQIRTLMAQQLHSGERYVEWRRKE